MRAALALEHEAWRIVRSGQISDAGALALASVSASIAAGLSHMPDDVQEEIAKKALLLLAQTDFEAAANALAGLLMASTNRLVAADLLSGGNVVKLTRTPAVKVETTNPKPVTAKGVAKLRAGFQLAGMTHAEIEKTLASLARMEMEAKLDQAAAELADLVGRNRKPPADA